MNEIIQQLSALLNARRSGQLDAAAYNAQARPLLEQLKASGGDPNMVMSFSPQTVEAAITSRNKQEFAQKIQSAYGASMAAVDLAQLINSFDQIKTAQQAARQTPMPGLPTPPPQNTQLSEQIYSAQRAVGDIGYAINPATQQLNQAYAQSLGQAQAATGGQASNFQALANLANQQRMQAALQLVPMAQQARMENQQLSNQLLGQRLQEQQRSFENQMAVYPYAYDAFNRKQEAIGALGSQGRSYALDAISRLPEYLQYLPFDADSNNFIRNTRMQYDMKLSPQGRTPSDYLNNMNAPL